MLPDITCGQLTGIIRLTAEGFTAFDLTGLQRALNRLKVVALLTARMWTNCVLLR